MAWLTTTTDSLYRLHADSAHFHTLLGLTLALQPLAVYKADVVVTLF